MIQVEGALALAGLIVLTSAAWLTWRWSVGQSSAVPWLRGIAGLPLAYLHDVHEVVARERRAGTMHALTAGGLLVSCLILGIAGLVDWRGPTLGWALLACAAGMSVGAGLVAIRRWPTRPRRLSGGSFQLLPAILILFVVGLTGFGANEARPYALASIFSVGLAVAIVAIALLVALGPLKHILAGTMHLIVHPRRERFGANLPSVGIKALDLTSARLGAGNIRDFAWNRLVGFDACIQCGRCEQACPAFAAGLPLNPKALIQDFVAAMPGGRFERYSGSPHPNGSADLPVNIIELATGGAGVRAETIWACTTCRACVQECPMMIEHVDAIISIRRHQTLEMGATPGKAPVALKALAETDNPGGRALSTRLDWAVDLRLPRFSEVGTADVLFWLGDGAYNLRSQRTLRAMVQIMRKAGVDFAVLGEEELDCGDFARRLGDEATFQDLARRNIEILSRYRFQRIVTVDPHVFNSFKNDYLALGARYDVVHHTTFMGELIERGAIRIAKPITGEVTYHDPCYLGRYNREITAPRTVLDRIGAQRIEMVRSGMRSFCCGGGGGAPETDISGKRRIPDVRMDQIRETGAPIVAVACPNCAIMLEGTKGPRPDVVDIAELLERSL